jgi:quinol monooxygenase YgiN
MMNELFVVVALHAKKGKEDELRRDLITVVEPSRKEEGNLRYELFVDQSDPGRFVFVEHWTTADAQQKHHTKGPHIQHFNAHGASNVERIEFLHMLSRIA